MGNLHILNVVGARPNFMKVAPVHGAMCAEGWRARLVHTGQHYDEAMSRVFFRQLGMPEPDTNLGVGSGTHAVQTARIMEAFESLVLEERPDAVLVAGDVNSTIACALVAAKLGVPVAHLEAGLRSYDRAMPEEINRVLTDQLSDVLLTPSADADDNLAKEGIAESRVFRVGNAMIDSLRGHLDAARSSSALDDLGLKPGGYGLMTLHRPSNVDDEPVLRRLLDAVLVVAGTLPIVFPVHPRTRDRMVRYGVHERAVATAGLRMVSPLGYLEFLALQADAALVLTDSGGIQEETTALGVPCLTLRENTERPVTVTEGTNTVVGTDPDRIVSEATAVIEGRSKRGRIPALWDGQTAHRVVKVLADTL